ncbi:proline-rich protein 5-like isoform X2 [Brienomyrus brachyistius]|uniref:proline-rich protein 5-like isoform X2 n=1 Tax=Brienomyrus brachyistius TaxID=42636 RepID=UPI0020B2A302|nr:proline-rich protein 5-like isoform X2 [Brienomyrus brachyistius]
MGSLRRPRPRFMSSPVLTDLPRFHASAPALQLTNASVWNSVQSAVIKVFQGGGLQSNELYSLNESIRWLLKTELGSFFKEYFQNKLLNKGLEHIAEKIQLCEGDGQLLILSEMWSRFFMEILPTLQAIFYPVQGQELSVRQMALLGFRDLVLLKLQLEELLPPVPTSPPPAITQMLLVLQGIHEPSGPSQEYCQLEKLVDMVVSPYLGNYLHRSPATCFIEHQPGRPRTAHLDQPEILITQHTVDSSSLAPLVEQEGEAYLEKAGGMRRHTVASAHSDLQLLTIKGAKCPARTEARDSGEDLRTVQRHIVGKPLILEDVMALPLQQDCAEFSYPSPS